MRPDLFARLCDYRLADMAEQEEVRAISDEQARTLKETLVTFAHESGLVLTVEYTKQNITVELPQIN